MNAMKCDALLTWCFYSCRASKSYSPVHLSLADRQVIDNGSGMCKAGFAGDDAPRAVFP
jgi:hypothetical protein